MPRPCAGSPGDKYRALLQLRGVSGDSQVICQPSTNPRNRIFHQTLCLTGWVLETLIVPSGSGGKSDHGRGVQVPGPPWLSGHLQPGPHQAAAGPGDRHHQAPTEDSVMKPPLKGKKRLPYCKGCSPQ